MPTYLDIVNGENQQQKAVSTTAGAADANKIVALDAAGLLSNNLIRTKRVSDTRSSNSPPSYYMNNANKKDFKIFHEFKRCNVLGLTSSNDYCSLITHVRWSDFVNGLVYQKAITNDAVMERRSISANAWGVWQDVTPPVSFPKLNATFPNATNLTLAIPHGLERTKIKGVHVSVDTGTQTAVPNMPVNGLHFWVADINATNIVLKHQTTGNTAASLYGKPVVVVVTYER